MESTIRYDTTAWLDPTMSYVTTPSPDTSNWRVDVWYILFLVTAILGFIGNAAICWIVWAHRSMKTITNIYIGNMGIGGLFITLFGFPFLFPYHTYWYIWEAPGFCVLYEFATTTGTCVFVFALMMMLVEKYYAIELPDEDMPSIRYRPTFNIWFFSFLIAVPNWLLAALISVSEASSEPNFICYSMWPKYLGGENARQIYMVFLAFATYFIPVGIMVYRSAQLAKYLWGHNLADLSATDKVSQKQTVKMLIMQEIVFIILWFPFGLCTLFDDFSSTVTMRESDLLITFYWMAMSSTVFYPVIYICMEERFKKKLSKVFKCCPCVDYESKKVNYALGTRKQSCDMVESYRVLSDV